jgi:hypothetical protein
VKVDVMPFESQSRQPVQEEKAERSRAAGDRKLGDEWEDWSGDIDEDIDEPKGRFILLTNVIWVVFALGLIAAGYLVEPRLREWPIGLQWFVRIALGVLFVGGFLFYCLVMLEVLSERFSMLPYRWSERMLLWLLPKAVWIGSRVGLSKDRVANSFVKVHNALIRSYDRQINRKKLMILLPRCLNKDTRREIKDLAASNGYDMFTVGGGEEAWKVIRQHRPSFIIALACERDLVSGIKDVALRIPVIGIANKRPEGPCKNTYIDMDEFRRALDFFQDTHQEQPISTANR